MRYLRVNTILFNGINTNWRINAHYLLFFLPWFFKCFSDRLSTFISEIIVSDNSQIFGATYLNLNTLVVTVK